MNLRPYQKDAVKKIINSHKEYNKSLIVCPTGTGKTVIFSEYIKRATAKNKRVLVIAHRDELLQQAKDKLYAHAGIESALEKGKDRACDNDMVVIASEQTLAKENRLSAYNRDAFDIVIIDEAHHALSEGYMRIINYFDKAKLLGVTATPTRGDLRDLSGVFEDVPFRYSIKQAIHDGYLSKIKIRTVPLSIDMNDVHTVCGDYKAGDVAASIDPYLEDIANSIKEYASDRKTLIFVPLIEIGEKFADILNNHGIKAANISGVSKDRKELLEKFHTGEITCLCNSMLLTEGYDEPSVDCIVNLRATKSRGLYEQIMGRGLRLYPGKEDLLVLDFLWHSKKKGFNIMNPIDIYIGEENQSFAKAIAMENAKNEEDIDIDELEKMAIGNRLDYEQDLINRLRKAQDRTCMGIKFKELEDPEVIYTYDENDNLDYVTLPHSDFLDYYNNFAEDDLYTFFPISRWQVTPATDKQMEFIKNIGGNTKLLQFKGQVSAILQAHTVAKEKGALSFKQYRFLLNRNFRQDLLFEMKSEMAKKIITAISNNYWRIPREYKCLLNDAN